MRCVYFIKPIGMDGPVKIGCSASPETRCQALATWSPFALEVVASIEGDFDLERRFHAKFVHLHERREWFRLGPDLTETIEAIREGAFDVSTLPDPLFISSRLNGQRQTQRHGANFGRQLSYSLRVSHLERRTGYKCPVYPTDMVRLRDVNRIETVEAFLADPAAHGNPIEAPWAEKARAKVAIA